MTEPSLPPPASAGNVGSPRHPCSHVLASTSGEKHGGGLKPPFKSAATWSPVGGARSCPHRRKGGGLWVHRPSSPREVSGGWGGTELPSCGGGGGEGRPEPGWLSRTSSPFEPGLGEAGPLPGNQSRARCQCPPPPGAGPCKAGMSPATIARAGARSACRSRVLRSVCGAAPGPSFPMFWGVISLLEVAPPDPAGGVRAPDTS